MKKRLLTSALILSSVLPLSARAEDISFSKVILQGLDKITGRLSTMTVNVGEKTTFGALDVYARVCYKKPPEETPENSAFLEVVENKQEGQLKLFSGWMFSSSPALSAMDHAVYDVWVLRCTGEEALPPVPEKLILDNPIVVKKVQPKIKLKLEEKAEEFLEKEQDEAETPVNPETIKDSDSVDSSDSFVADDELKTFVIQVDENDDAISFEEEKMDFVIEPIETPVEEKMEHFAPDTEAMPENTEAMTENTEVTPKLEVIENPVKMKNEDVLKSDSMPNFAD